MQNPVDRYKRAERPLILAHRGMVTQFQENTMPAIQAAMNSNSCDGCEFDVFMTKDERIVLFHDENMKRVTGIDKSIYDMTWPEISELDVLSSIEVDGGMRDYSKTEKIPLLSEVLEEIRGKDFFVDLEIKAYTPRWSKRKTGELVAKVVGDLGMEEQLICSSFDFFMLHRLEKKASFHLFRFCL